jgi:hypothetical protein
MRDCLAVLIQRLPGGGRRLQQIVDRLGACCPRNCPEQCRTKAAGAEHQHRPLCTFEHRIEAPRMLGGERRHRERDVMACDAGRSGCLIKACRLRLPDPCLAIWAVAHDRAETTLCHIREIARRQLAADGDGWGKESRLLHSSSLPDRDALRKLRRADRQVGSVR